MEVMTPDDKGWHWVTEINLKLDFQLPIVYNDKCSL